MRAKNFNDVYSELADIVSVEDVMQIYNLFGGTQITFPKKLFSKEYIISNILDEYDGNNIKSLAKKWNYSERWVREVIKSNKFKENNVD